MNVFEIQPRERKRTSPRERADIAKENYSRAQEIYEAERADYEDAKKEYVEAKAKWRAAHNAAAQSEAPDTLDDK